MTKLKDLFGRGLVMFFEKDGGFVPIKIKITNDRKPIIVISATHKLGCELEKKSLQAVNELSKNVKADSTHSIIKELRRVIFYLR